MLKKFYQLIFPVLVFSVFIGFPVLISFNDNLDNLTTSNDFSRLSSNTISDNLDKSILVSRVSKSRFSFYSPDDQKNRVPYDETRISNFNQAVDSLMRFYVSQSYAYEKSQSELPFLVKDIETEPKAYDALVAPPRPPIPVRPPNRGSYSGRLFSFKSYDEYKQVEIPQQLVAKGHLAVSKQFTQFPREITKEDQRITSSTNLAEMFFLYFEDYFEYDFKETFGKDPTRVKYRKRRDRILNHWEKTYKIRKECLRKLKDDLFENKGSVKLTGCKYAFDPNENVTIYYNLDADVFAIVREKDRFFLKGGVASLCDYLDIFYFNEFGNQTTFNQSKKLEKTEKLEEFKLPQLPQNEQKPSSGFPQLTEGELQEKLNAQRDVGLPYNYNPECWWVDKEQELVQSFLKKIQKSYDWYAQLKIGDTGKSNSEDSSEPEAFTMLQLEAEGYLTGVRRPDKTDRHEEGFNTDGRFDDVNSMLINCKPNKPTAFDVKVPRDPQALAARNQPVRSLELQVTDLVEKVKFQHDRAKNKYNETLLHVINLFQIRPADRLYFIELFKVKAHRLGVNLDYVIFLLTRSDSIY